MGRCRRPDGARICSSSSIGQGVTAPIYNDAVLYAQQWNFDFERELPGGMALRLPMPVRKERICPARTSNSISFRPEFMALGSRLQEQVPNPFFGLVTSARWRSPSCPWQLLRPYPQYNGFSMKNPTQPELDLSLRPSQTGEALRQRRHASRRVHLVEADQRYRHDHGMAGAGRRRGRRAEQLQHSRGAIAGAL